MQAKKREVVALLPETSATADLTKHFQCAQQVLIFTDYFQK
jgi:hypothetical protein